MNNSVLELSGKPLFLRNGQSVSSSEKPIEGSVTENEPAPGCRKVKKHADEPSSPAYKLVMKAINIRNENTERKTSSPKPRSAVFSRQPVKADMVFAILR